MRLSRWGATSSSTRSTRAGLDVEAPQGRDRQAAAGAAAATCRSTTGGSSPHRGGSRAARARWPRAPARRGRRRRRRRRWCAAPPSARRRRAPARRRRPTTTTTTTRRASPAYSRPRRAGARRARGVADAARRGRVAAGGAPRARRGAVALRSGPGAVRRAGGRRRPYLGAAALGVCDEPHRQRLPGEAALRGLRHQRREPDRRWLAALLGQPPPLVTAAISVACRLGFAQLKTAPPLPTADATAAATTTDSVPPWHPSWGTSNLSTRVAAAKGVAAAWRTRRTRRRPEPRRARGWGGWRCWSTRRPRRA